jgi:hypothetical protein
MLAARPDPIATPAVGIALFVPALLRRKPTSLRLGFNQIMVELPLQGRVAPPANLITA